jgi:hypothetical protein
VGGAPCPDGRDGIFECGQECAAFRVPQARRRIGAGE